MKIGILGAGNIGGSLARLLRDAGHELLVSSRRPERIDIESVQAGTPKEAALFGDIVIAAVPLIAARDLPAAELQGKIVVDAMNYIPDRDGRIAELDAFESTTSQWAARYAPGAIWVKAFNAILADDLPRGDRPPVKGNRALPIAGDDAGAKTIVAERHADIGFDALDAGSLDESWRFERAMPAYCIPLNRAELADRLAAAKRGQELPHNSWHR
ncbi:NADPH-dependent F420 reductase [Salinisphaera sp. Q1T1-3]|uniref:NADPH-dependent F420 reductase n=1 Tax=Salinisphaera sp. Q1T1-3 TaxID=2321229 RepID=UPI000E70FF18|nr:NAD(P)-binding domain-containing protein [Salinisphaera sp. Q1T1-3]RJS90999.1 NADP oxidoreductase [Salinisphaera sp. Q1T1-3]